MTSYCVRKITFVLFVGYFQNNQLVNTLRASSDAYIIATWFCYAT